MLAMFEPQRPKWLTGVVTGDKTFISFYGMPSNHSNMVCLSEAKDRSAVLLPGFQSKKWLFTVFFNHAEPMVVNIMISHHYIQE